jgi:2-phospho-L-lactate guanylyltransferase
MTDRIVPFAGDLIALVPCKGFSSGKSRLSPVLSPEGRATLCRTFLADTLRKLAMVTEHIVVVTADVEAVRMARDAGASVVEDRGLGLNSALRTARGALARQRSRVLIAPTDLPCADAAAIRRFLAVDGDVVIAPDRSGNGTNLLALTRGPFAAFSFTYGMDSFDRHLTISAEGGWRTAIVRDPALALDIDLPADLRHLGCRNGDGHRRAA